MNQGILYWQKNSCLVVTEQNDFSINFDSISSIENCIETLFHELKDKSIKLDQATLLLENDFVFNATLSTENLPRRNKIQALCYQLEDHLPVDAETLTADFITINQTQNLAVAVKTETLQLIIDSLENEGIEIVSIAPASIALFNQINNSKIDYLLINTGKQFELATIAGSKFIKCNSAKSEHDIEKIILASRLSENSSNNEISILATDNFKLSLPGFEVKYQNFDLIKQLRLMISKRPSINLRKDKLAQQSQWSKHKVLLNMLTICACLFPLVLLLGIHLRTSEYQKLAKSNRRAQREIFSQIYPNEKPPLDVPRVLKARLSERKDFAKSPLPEKYTTNAFITLNKALEKLPPKFKIRLHRIKASASSVEIQGVIAKPANPEDFAEWLKSKGFSVAPVTFSSTNEKFYPLDIDAKLKDTSNEK